MPSKSSMPDRLMCSHCSGTLRTSQGGRVAALIVAIAGGFIGLHLCWHGRGGWLAYFGGVVGFILAGLLGGVLFLRLKRDSSRAV